MTVNKLPNQTDILSHAKSIGYAVHCFNQIPDVFSTTVVGGGSVDKQQSWLRLESGPTTGDECSIELPNEYVTDSVNKVRRLWVFDTGSTNPPSTGVMKIGFGIEKSDGFNGSYVDLKTEELSSSGVKRPLDSSLNIFDTYAFSVETDVKANQTTIGIRGANINQVEVFNHIGTSNKTTGAFLKSEGVDERLQLLYNSRTFDMGVEI